MIKVSSNSKLHYPIQLDIWIIPKDVIQDTGSYIKEEFSSSYDIDSDDEYDIDDDQKKNQNGLFSKYRLFNYRFGNNKDENENKHKYKLNITKKLKSNKKQGIISDFDMLKLDRNPMKYLKALQNYLQKKLCNLKPNKRYILIIDRRKENSDINVYFYPAPKSSNCISKEHHSYLRYDQLWHSHKCILPRDPTVLISSKSRDIGLYDTENGYMFGLSYHINSKNSIASYWSSHGSSIRFFAKDMKHIWPYYFVQDMSNNICNVHSMDLCSEFQDDPFQKFYENTTGRKDLYSSHSMINSINDEYKFDVIESGSDEEKHADDIKNEGQRIIDKLKSLHNIWSKCVMLSIQNIKDRFDLDDVKFVHLCEVVCLLLIETW